MSSIARQIRNADDSEQFDLAGFTEARVRELVLEAFVNPIPHKDMIRFSFVVGGGKLVRARYHDDLGKWLTTALRDVCSFTEDRSGAETFDSQGTFKQQHDTGQNLKFVIVFPRIDTNTALGESSSSGVEGEEKIMSPEDILKLCEVSTFFEIIGAKTHSWRQRKRVLKLLKDAKEIFSAIEAKIMKGASVDANEESFFNSVTSENLNEKISWLQTNIKTFVDEGKLTASEKNELIESMSKNIEQAIEEGHADKANTLRAKKVVVEAIAPIRYRLSKCNKIQELRVKQLQLLALDDKKRSMSLTMADLKQLEELPEIESSITELENISRGWFLSEEDFSAMCAIEVAEAATKFKKQGSTQSKQKSTTSSSSNSKTQGTFQKVASKASSNSFVAKAGGTSKTKGSNAFANAFGNDSDSD